MALPKVGVQLVVEGLSSYLSGLNRGAQAVSDFGRTVSSQEGRISAFREVVIGAFRQIGALGVNTLTSAASSLVSLGQSGFQVVASYEMMAKSLEALAARELIRTGTAQNMAEAMALAGDIARQNIDWLERLAIVSPYQAEDIAGAYRLGAALGFSTEQLKELISRTVDWGSATGQSGAAVERVMLALGQMWTKGKATGEEMLQLIEAGVPAWEYLAGALGTTTQQAQELVSKGLIPADYAIQAISDGLNRDFQGAAEASSTTLQGLTSSLSDLATRVLRSAMTPALRAVQPYLVQLVDLLGSPELLGTVEGLGRVLGDITRSVIEFTAGIITADDPTRKFIEVLTQIHPVLGTIAEGVVAGLVSLSEVATSQLLPGLSSISEAVSTVVNYFLELAVGGDTARTSLSSLPTPVQAIVKSFGEIVSWARNTIGVFLESSDAHQAWAGVVNRASSTVMTVIGALGQYVQTVFSLIQEFISRHGADISRVLVTAWQTISEIIQTALLIIQTIIKAVLPAVTGFIQDNQETILQIIKTVWDTISGVILAALTAIRGILTAILRALQGDWQGAWDVLSSTTRDVINQLGSILNGLKPLAEAALRAAGNALYQVWQSATNSIKQLASDFVSSLVATITGLQSSLVSAFQQVIDGAKQVWNGFVSDARSIGSRLIDGVTQGVRDAAGRLVQEAQRAIQGALDSVQSALGIRSPSQYAAEEIGDPIAQGIALGILRSRATIENALRGVSVTAVTMSRPPIVVQQSSVSSTSFTYAPTFAGESPSVGMSFETMKVLMGG